jgi:formylglycine-generating enzyme required for sulfatase activity
LTVLHMQIHTTPPPIAGIPPEVQAVLDRALLKNPADRYQTSSEMAIDYYLSIGMNRQAETILEPYPVRADPIEEPAPPEPELAIKPDLAAKSKLTPKTELAIKPEPTSKPPRSQTGMRAILFSVIGLSVLALAGYLIFSRGPNVPTATATLSTVIPETVGPATSEPVGLPEATRMVKIDAGTYQIGKDPANNNQSASQSISLPEFWIDQYQVTNKDFQVFVPGWSITPGQDNYPAMGVTWDQADAYCKSINKRLPNEAEWEVAGRGPGPEPQLYPWGNDSNEALKLPSESAYEVGTQSINVSPFQVYDLVGNVWEWVGEPYGSLEAGKKILRGGRFGNPQSLVFRLAVAPDDVNSGQFAGFRCAADQVR